MRRILAAVGAAACLMGTPMLANSALAAAPNHFYYGQCTWWAAHTRPDIGARVFGNAANWLSSAQRAGLKTGTVPKADAIVVYAPGVQGAWGSGHVAHVNEVEPDGVHFRVDEMDYPFPGVMTLRMSHAGPGVSFIY